jgi:hypothetical protein
VVNDTSRNSTPKTTAETRRTVERDDEQKPQHQQLFIEDQLQLLDAPVSGPSTSATRQRRCILDTRLENIGAEQFLADVKKKRKSGTMKIEFAVSWRIAPFNSMNEKTRQTQINRKNSDVTLRL